MFLQKSVAVYWSIFLWSKIPDWSGRKWDYIGQGQANGKWFNIVGKSNILPQKDAVIHNIFKFL